ncbi:MAG TPA: heme-binding domain-containing protein [Terracidiphilus sp.]|nr:heme-binding domain-containing protein [Terracidiphilus sp.]
MGASIVMAGFVAAFLLAFIHPFGRIGSETQSDSALQWGHDSIPPGIRGILAAKCSDCHSLATRKPAYIHLAPASWLIERDVLRARGAMNLSAWDSESADDRQMTIARIAAVASKGEMPPLQYLVLHWNSRLTRDDVHALSDWAQSTAPGGATSGVGGPTQGDAARGKAVFEKHCTGCHALDRDREGPRLGGVYGRTAGSVAGFDYSKALKASNIVWNETTLERWLTDPQTMVPGADMDFYLAKPDERADVIAFLRERSQQAAPNQSR